ncbi:MAG TPA: hypothetical protein VKI45_08410 [Allosphingosinicella sp.]|nr:hypothetical protein [Allosphingosinicella sp.]
MQRVRIGLTGLAFVFILVLLGAIFTSPSNEESAANAVKRQLGRGASASGTPGNEASPTEPLAKLGVAPGNADENVAVPAASPAPAPAAAPAPRH